MMKESANAEFESVVSEDATVQSVTAEETVNDGMTVDGDADLLEMAEEEVAPLEPIEPVLEPIVEPLIETVVDIPVVEAKVAEKTYKLKVKEQWFKSWKPYVLVDTEEEATVLNEEL